MFDADRLKAWTVTALQWAKRQWPDQLASCTLHVSEATPHMHLLVVPRVRKGAGWHLNSKALFDRERLRELQSAYADALAPLNIVRGEPGSEARHTEVKQFYGAMQAAQAVPERPTLPPAPKAPTPPAGLRDRLMEGMLHLLGRETARDRAMKTYRSQLAAWRAEVRTLRTKEADAWESLKAAAAFAPLARKKGAPRARVIVPETPTPEVVVKRRPRPRM